MSTPGQIKKIKTLQSKLKMSDEDYRITVMSVNADGFAGSCKDLSFEEAGVLIETLEKMAVEAGIWTPLARTDKKYDNLGGRMNFATPAQIRKVEAMFHEVSWYKDNPKAFAHAFRNFLHRIARVDDVNFLEKKDVPKVIRALEYMKAQNKTRQGTAGTGGF